MDPQRSAPSSVYASGGSHGCLRGTAMRTPVRLGTERPDPEFRRHEPHQAPGEGFLKRATAEVVFFKRVQRDDPTGVVHGPGAVAAAGRDHAAPRILEGAAFEGRINAGVRNGAGEVPCKDRPITQAHKRCSRSQTAGHPNQNVPSPP
jgi:hypothetical protein